MFRKWMKGRLLPTPSLLPPLSLPPALPSLPLSFSLSPVNKLPYLC